MVVEHLHDLRLFHASNGLRQLIVVDEHQSRPRWIDHVRLKRDASEQAVVAHDRKDWLRRPLDDAPGLAESHLGRQGDDIEADCGVDKLGRPDTGGGVDGVERAQHHRHAACLRQLDQAGAQFEATGDHQATDALLDSGQLNRGPVAADHEHAVSVKLLHPCREAVSAHRSHHHDQLVGPQRIFGMLK